MSDRYDVAIVGASLAGCTAATLFARRGLSVALVERHGSPDAYKRTCTHFIQPSATPTLERLGVAEAIEAAGGVRNSLDIWSRDGWLRGRYRGPDGKHAYGYNIRREVLDPMLRRLAAESAGVDLMPGLAATGLVSAGDRVAGVVARGRDGAERTLRARLVVAADGRGSSIAELAGVRARASANRRFMYFAYFRGPALEPAGTGQLWFLEPDVAYVYPNDDGLLLAACAVVHERLPAFKADLEGRFLDLLDTLPDAPALRSAERVSPIAGKLDMPNVRRRVAQPGLALVGDAALASDPLWAVGCGWALQSAEWLVEHTAPAFGGAASELDRALRRYRRRHRSELLAHHLVSTSYSSGRAFLPHERLFLRAGVRDQLTAARVAGFGERLLGVGGLMSPRSLGRALRVVASPVPRTASALAPRAADCGPADPARPSEQRSGAAVSRRRWRSPCGRSA